MVGRNRSLKSPMTPPGIDPGTVRLVAQRLNLQAPNERGFVFLALQPIVVVFSKPGGGL